MPAKVLLKGKRLFSGGSGVSSTLQSVVTRVAVAAFNLGTGMFMARNLGVLGRGSQAAIILWPTLLTYLMTFGIPNAIRYYIPRDRSNTKAIYSSALLSAIPLSLATIAVGYIFLPYWLHSFSGGTIHDARICIWFALEVMLGLIAIATLDGIGDFTSRNIAIFLQASMTLVLLVGAGLAHRLNPLTAALAYIVPSVPLTTWLLWKLREHFSFRSFRVRLVVAELGSYGLRSYGLDVVGTLSAQVDQAFVLGFLNAHAMGLYVVALSASRVLGLISQAVASVLFPKAAALGREPALELVGRATRMTAAVSGICAVVLASSLPVLIPLVYSGPFAAAVPVAVILTLEAWLSGIVYVLAQAFMALDRPGALATLQAISLATTIPFLIILVPRFGIFGAALALSLSTVVRFISLLASFPICLGAAVPLLIPKRDDFVTLKGALLDGA